MTMMDRLQRGYLRLHQAVYVGRGGVIGHGLASVPSLILRTTGRRSGEQRTAILIYARDGADSVVVASNHGLDRPPGWLVNIEAEPTVIVQIGRRRAPAVARAVGGGDPDYARQWDLVNANDHGRYRGYQARTSRPIPIVVITPERPLA